MTIQVPEGCALTLYPGSREAVGSDDKGEDLYTFHAECACGEWASGDLTANIASIETAVRSAWLSEHLNPMQDSE